MNNIQSNKQQGFTVIELMFTIAAIGSIILTGGCIYVAVHFISKFW